MLCKYKDVFGVPGHGVHAYRFLGVAVVDLALTILVAALIGWDNFFSTFAILLILSVCIHLLFCVDTALIKYLKKLFAGFNKCIHS